MLRQRRRQKPNFANEESLWPQKLKNLRKEQAAACIINAGNKLKNCWQVIKEERTAVNKSNNIGNSLHDNERTVEDPVEVANCFNEFFASIAEKNFKK